MTSGTNLNSRQADPEADAIRTDAAHDAEPEDLQGLLLRAPSRIETLLGQLQRQRVLLSVRVAGAPQWHASIVVAVDGAKHRLSIDTLHPAPASAPAVGTMLDIRGRVDGSDVRLHCHVAGHTTIEGVAALTLDFPEHILVLERRAAFRLKLPEFLKLEPSRIGLDHERHDAQLVDLSHTGAAAIVPDHVEPAVGDTLSVSLRLPGAVIDAEAVVRSITPGRNGIRVGLQLGALRHEDESHLAHAITRLERQLIRATRASR